MSHTAPAAGADPRCETGAESVVLGQNQYGKAEVRLVKVDRDQARHHITDLSVTSQLRGDFTAAHTRGDNTSVVTTDTQKNTIFALARDPITSPEQFVIRLGEHFTSGFDQVSGGRWEIHAYPWQHIPTTRSRDAEDGEHHHSFVRGGTETRTAVVQRDGPETFVIAGLQDLSVLKSTGSEFHGFPRDRFTTLAETTDRVLATAVTARWRYRHTDIDFNTAYGDVRRLLLETFAELHSLALQQSLFEMGTVVLQARPEIAEIKLSMPNLHHFLVDLEPFGMDNPNEVFSVADRPYGLIEGEVRREGLAPEPRAWAGVAGFC